MGPKVLEGIRVIELSRSYQGAHAAALLGDLGAEVLKVEPLAAARHSCDITEATGRAADLPDGREAVEEYHNRNKRGMALELQSPRAREIICRLVQKCDVFVTNYPPHQLEKLGLDYSSLSQVNSRLIYAKLSATADHSTERDMASVDPCTSISRSPLAPCVDASRIGSAYGASASTSSMDGVGLGFAILAAITARERFGFGQEVEWSSAWAVIIEIQRGSREPKLLGCPWRLAKTPMAICRPAPGFGEHTEDVLIEWAGFDWDQIASLREAKVI